MVFCRAFRISSKGRGRRCCRKLSQSWEEWHWHICYKCLLRGAGCCAVSDVLPCMTLSNSVLGKAISRASVYVWECLVQPWMSNTHQTTTWWLQLGCGLWSIALASRGYLLWIGGGQNVVPMCGHATITINEMKTMGSGAMSLLIGCAMATCSKYRNAAWSWMKDDKINNGPVVEVSRSERHVMNDHIAPWLQIGLQETWWWSNGPWLLIGISEGRENITS